MKRHATLLIANFMAVALATSLGAAIAADTAPIAPAPARISSQPATAGSPAVQAAEKAQVPGDVRPEKRPVPQLNLALKRNAPPDESSAVAQAHGDGVNDEKASCVAIKNKRERASCAKAASALKGEPTVKR